MKRPPHKPHTERSHEAGKKRRGRARKAAGASRRIGRPSAARAGDDRNANEDENREQRREQCRWRYHPAFRQSTMYCAPAGTRVSLTSSGLSAARTRGKTNRKSVPRISKPALARIVRASLADSSCASLSNGIRRITRRVPGFQGLFSQNAKYPPSESDRCR